MRLSTWSGRRFVSPGAGETLRVQDVNLGQVAFEDLDQLFSQASRSALGTTLNAGEVSRVDAVAQGSQTGRYIGQRPIAGQSCSFQRGHGNRLIWVWFRSKFAQCANKAQAEICAERFACHASEKKNQHMDIGQIIRKARKAKGWTLEELAHRIGTDAGNMSRLERGKQGASRELLAKVLNELNISLTQAGQLDEGSNVAVALQPTRKDKEYPLISWVIAGDWTESPDNCHPGDAESWVASTENAGNHGFWLNVRGDSMTCAGNPSFPAGSLILVRPEADVISGKYYVVEMLDSGEKTFKQYVEDAGLKYLRPLNPNYRTIEINGNCRFIGRVIDAKMTGL